MFSIESDIVQTALKGDDRSFSKWLPREFYFGYTGSITAFYVGLWHKMYVLFFYQYSPVLEQK